MVWGSLRFVSGLVQGGFCAGFGWVWGCGSRVGKGVLVTSEPVWCGFGAGFGRVSGWKAAGVVQGGFRLVLGCVLGAFRIGLGL